MTYRPRKNRLVPSNVHVMSSVCLHWDNRLLRGGCQSFDGNFLEIASIVFHLGMFSNLHVSKVKLLTLLGFFQLVFVTSGALKRLSPLLSISNFPKKTASCSSKRWFLTDFSMRFTPVPWIAGGLTTSHFDSQRGAASQAPYDQRVVSDRVGDEIRRLSRVVL